MKFCKKIALSLAVLILILFSSACGETFSIIHFISFKTEVKIVVDSPVSIALEKEIKAYLAGLENSLSLSVEDSLINRYNSLNEGETISFSTEFNDILTICKEVNKLTNGAFDPTVLPLTKLWQFSPDKYKVEDFFVPTDSEIISTKKRVSFDFIHEDTWIKKISDVEIDLGGVAKGYGAEEVAKKLISAGAKKGYVNIGRSSLYLIEIDSLGMRHPRKAGDTILTLNKSLKNIAVSTSGDYERYYEHDGKIYSHLINPKTGLPSDTGFASVMVLGESAVEVDALSTALCIFERGELINFIKEHGQTYSVVAVYIKGETKEIITSLSPSDFTLNDKEYEILKF